ncbi:MAG: ribose 5-phosphate isomerase B, partial [Myxococcales bacterium]|nr:ribose 5-phosphate isomerase B [Myxococcales bacterium]
GREVTDLGTMDAASVDYPDYAHRLARAIASASHERGILICGTGIGMSMAANRHAGVRAALCGDVFSARMTRLHNDANVLCLGARVVGVGLALEILQTFVRTEFEGGRHARRTAKIEP